MRQALCRGVLFMHVAIVALSCSPATLHAAPEVDTRGLGSLGGKVMDRATGAPLDFANVVVLGTTWGATARAGGVFSIAAIPPGTYQLRASYVGYEPMTRTEVRVDAGRKTILEFSLVAGARFQTDVVLVRPNPRQIDVRDTQVTHVETGKALLDRPVDSVQEALTFNTGVVVSGTEMHVRTGRSSEISFRIDDVPVDDPLSGGSLNLALLSVAEYEFVEGGMDAEYGNASSAVINYTTKSGGRDFEGNVRYSTDDYGRADKTFTNFDQFSIGLGGPSPFQNLTYFVSAEATFQDGETPTVRRYAEHELLGGLAHWRERASNGLRGQARLDWQVTNHIRMTGEATLAHDRSEPYLHNWNTAGYTSRIVTLPELRTNRFEPRFYTAFGQVVVYDGPWYEQALRAAYVDIRENPACEHCLMPIADNRTVRGVRVVDVQGRGADRTQPVYALVDYILFRGYQNPVSTWVPDLGYAPGDSNKTYFNAAEHTVTTTNSSNQLRWSMMHSLSPKSFYEVKLSRLSFEASNTVGDKVPQEYATAGTLVWIPGRGPVAAGNAQYYTDPAVPYFATAYDDPIYQRRQSHTYLMRTDVTTQRWLFHKVKAGVLVQYDDLDNASLTNPGRQRQFRGSYGIGRNVFHSYTPQGSMYVQDRWSHEGMVLNGGVRYDFFSPGSGVGIEVHDEGVRRDVDRWKSQWSPRIGLAFPITDRDVFHFHYGRFVQFPEKNFVFASQDASTSIGSILGNPNLNPETSIAYQAGIKHQFTNVLSGQFALFSKDYYGLVSQIEVTDDSTGAQGFRYVNRAYASGRGLELSMDKAFSHGFGLEVSYTYSFADGVASSADFGRQASGLTHLPTGELPLDWDQRHTLNATLTLARSGDWQATTAYQYGSGLPWTPFYRFEKKQDPLLENTRRYPATHSISFRGEKFFKMRGQNLRIFFDGRNLLDQRIVVNIAPGVFPALQNATDGYLAYATERGRFGGAYLEDQDGDGRDEFYPVDDPRVFGQRRLFRVGMGFEF